jgi:hypothetical protein
MKVPPGYPLKSTWGQRGSSRGVGFAARAAIFFRERRASLTEAESGKVSSRSGSMRTRLLPSSMRFAYLPRTP